jgi:septum formation topological specificity factor MinE
MTAAGSRLEPRIRRLADEARERREATPVASSPRAETPPEAMEMLREGLAPVVSAYVEARTGEMVRLSSSELDLLHRATNDWLTCYARCHGVDADPDVTVREAAEHVISTHHIGDTAALLTGVPER